MLLKPDLHLSSKPKQKTGKIESTSQSLIAKHNPRPTFCCLVFVSIHIIYQLNSLVTEAVYSVGAIAMKTETQEMMPQINFKMPQSISWNLLQSWHLVSISHFSPHRKASVEVHITKYTMQRKKKSPTTDYSRSTKGYGKFVAIYHRSNHALTVLHIFLCPSVFLIIKEHKMIIKEHALTNYLSCTQIQPPRHPLWVLKGHTF